MLDSQLNLKLVDFGLAQVFDHTTVSEKDYPLFHQLKRLGGDTFPLLWATIHNPHQTDLANGTEGYAPPEVWKCQLHSFGIDYFAMGCVLHMLITSNVRIDLYICDFTRVKDLSPRHHLNLTRLLGITPMTRYLWIRQWMLMRMTF